MAILAKKTRYGGIKKCIVTMMETIDYSDCLHTKHLLELYIEFSLDRVRKDHIQDQ
jgi:hypothetical protein